MSTVDTFETVSQQYLTIGVIVLVGVNCIPLVGVLMAGWDVGTLLLLYWIENAVIGLVTAGKMLFAVSTESDEAVARRPRLRNLPSIGFFFVHYGMFWVLHGIFLVSFFVIGDPASISVTDQAVSLLELGLIVPLSDLWYVLAVLGFAVSHSISTIRSAIATDTSQMITIGECESEAYRRVIVLHFTLFVGAIALGEMGSPLYGLIALVVLKTGFDLHAERPDGR